MDTNAKIAEMQSQIQKLQSQLSDLSSQFYKNNFSSSQTFNKDAIFQSRLRVPVFSSAPSTAEIGDIFSLTNGKLYVCTTAGNSSSPAVFTLVGSQT